MDIAVFGSDDEYFSEQLIKRVTETGREIGKRGYRLLSGGCKGLPEYAKQGALEYNCECIVYPAATDIDTHTERDGFPYEGVSEFKWPPKENSPDYINLDNPGSAKQFRCTPLVAACDAGIVLGGGRGTGLEVYLSLIMKKYLGVLKDTGLRTDELIPGLLRWFDMENSPNIVFEYEPNALIDKIENLKL